MCIYTSCGAMEDQLHSEDDWGRIRVKGKEGNIFYGNLDLAIIIIDCLNFKSQNVMVI